MDIGKCYQNNCILSQMFNEWEIPLNIWTHYLPPTLHPILRWSHHCSCYGDTPAPPMIIVFILVTSPVRARRATLRLRPFRPSPFRLRNPKPCLPALCIAQNPDTRFAPNIFNVVWFSSYRLLGVERGMIYQVDSWIDGLGMMQKCNERSTFAVVAQSAAVEQATE